MDPYVQATLTALVSAALLIAGFFLVVPHLPADPPRKPEQPKPAE